MNKTERISGAKLVVTTSKKGIKAEQYVVTTQSGVVVFVPKAQFDLSAESITYAPLKKGDTWTNTKTGETGVRLQDGNNFVVCGRTGKLDLIDYLLSKNITPTFSISA